LCREEGREEGREALLNVARKLLARNTPVADVAELTGLEAAAIENIT
jgi:predicted transposase YdaD